MTIVMFHSGCKFPEFLKDCFHQLRLFNPDVPVYFITDRMWLSNPVFTLNNITAVDKSDYESDEIKTFEVLFGREKNDFWTITTTRLMYISNFICTNHLHDVYHFENDVLLYFKIQDYNHLFTRLFYNLAITFGGPDKAMTGFMFIKSSKSLIHLTNFFVSLLHNSSIHQIRKMYGMDMVNEMTLIRCYSREYPQLIETLPILPFGDWSVNFNEFNSLFDPASWGQYVGGTLDGIPGAKPEDHYIGQLLRAHPEYSVIWKIEEGRKIPYFRFVTPDWTQGTEVKINNLHIHSKQLHLYMS